MVYETDFYTVRRPYTRPTITSYSVTGYRPCVWRTTQISPLGAHSKVRLSVLLGELNRIQNRPRMHLGYVPTEDFLNSRPLVDFDDETKYIRAEADKLLRYIYVPVPHQKLAPKITTSYDRLTSNGIVPYSRTSRNISNDIINMSYYPEPTRATIGRGHLACITFAGGRGYPRRKHLFSDEYRDIGDEIKVRSYYNKNIHHSNRIDEALALPTGFASRLFRTEWKPYSVLEEEKKANKTLKIKRSENAVSKAEKTEKSANLENKQLSNEKLIENTENISKKSKSDESKKIVEEKLLAETNLNKSESTVEEKPKLKKESRTKSIEKSAKEEKEEIAAAPKKISDSKKTDNEQAKTEQIPEKKSTPAKIVDTDQKKLTDNKLKEESKKAEPKKPTVQKSESIEIKEKPKIDEAEKLLPEKKEAVKPEVKPEEKPEVKIPEEKPEVKKVEKKPEEKPEVKKVEEEKPKDKPEVKNVEEEKPQVKPEVKVEEKPQVEVEEKPEVKPDEKPELKKVEEKLEAKSEEVKSEEVKLEEKKPDIKTEEAVQEPQKIVEEIKTTTLIVEQEIKPTSEGGQQQIIEETENKSVEVEKDLKAISAETNVETEKEKLIIEEIPNKQDDLQQTIITEIQENKNQNNTELSQIQVVLEDKKIIHETTSAQSGIETVQIIETKESIITSQSSFMSSNNTDSIIPDEPQPIIEEPLSPEDSTIINPMIE